MFHSIKGASVVMGFEPVNRLTHHLESLFDQFRSKKRTLDRPVLDLTFRCLDELRDYHRDLRAGGPERGRPRRRSRRWSSRPLNTPAECPPSRPRRCPPSPSARGHELEPQPPAPSAPTLRPS